MTLQIKRLFPSRRRPGWLAISQHEGRSRIAHLERSGGRLCLLHASEHGSGDPAVLRRELPWLAECRVAALMPVGQYQLVQADAPAVPRAEWKDALRWKLKDLVEYPATATTFDVIDIPTEEFAPGRQRSCFVVASPDERVAEQMRRFAEGGLPLAALDVPELAQRNVATLLEDENRGLALLAFDASGGLLTVNYRGELYASRRIDVTPEQLQRADEERRQQLFERIALEVQRTLDAFDRQYSFMTVSRLLLVPHAETAGLAELFASYLYLPVAAFDLAGHVDCSCCPQLADPLQQGLFLQAIGAALREDEA